MTRGFWWVSAKVSATLFLPLACGGEVAHGPGSGQSIPVETDDAGAGADAAGGSGSSGFAESCAALADCCGEFSGSEAASCNTVADMGDDGACASQVETFQRGGSCIGQ